MNRQLGVLGFYVRNFPDWILVEAVVGGKSPKIGRVLAERIAAGLASFRISFFHRMAFARIELRHTDRVQIEYIVIGLGEPEQRFITTRQAFIRMKPEVESPDYTIPELKPLTNKHVIEIVV